MTSLAFWSVAAALCVAALAFLVVPLWRLRRREGSWSALTVAGAVATAPLAAAVYLMLSTWEPMSDAPADPAAMVAQLAARLQADPEDAMGWRLLGRGYRALGEYELSRQAFQEAWVRTPNPDNELKLALAEAQVLSDPRSLAGEAGRLIEEVVAVEPGNPTALWYGGLLARQQERYDVARERWSRLLELNPPMEIAAIIGEEIARLPGEVPGATAAASAPPAEVPHAIRLRVRLGEGHSAADLGAQPTLFVFARVPGERAPLAVLRLQAPALPAELTLSDADAMLPGRSLEDFDELTLVARLSATGDAMERPGDLYAQTRYRAGEEGVVELVIDHVVE